MASRVYSNLLFCNLSKNVRKNLCSLGYAEIMVNKQLSIVLENTIKIGISNSRYLTF